MIYIYNILDGTRQTTYAELETLSGKVAGKLHALDCTKGNIITILLDRRMEYIAALLGIMKAGCAAVPLVPHLPDGRIAYITKDCDARFTIDIGFFEDIDKYDTYEYIAQDDELALLIYTSGSTGTPKGILHTIKSINFALMRIMPVVAGINPIVDEFSNQMQLL